MSKSKARFLAELLSSDGKVIKTKSQASTIIVSDLPTIPNSKLANSSVTIAGEGLSLGASLTLDTGDVTEHTAYKYYTDARARASISATGSLSYNSTTGVMSFTMPAQNTSNITEGSNLYFTNARADARIVNAGSANWNTAYGWGNHASAGYLTSYTDTNTHTHLDRTDNRTISPSEYTSGDLNFGFTSWANNNTSPYADFIHMRSYTDSSGGSDNMVMFKKNGKGMRLWQQTFGSSTAYSSYVDIWDTGTLTTTNKANYDTAYGWGNHASAGYVTSSGNTIIGTDTDLSFSGANVLSTIALTDGVITAYTNRVLTLANLGYTGETNATADQTNAEIRAAVEAATDSNVFTNADHSKLDGIATGATNTAAPHYTSAIAVGAGGLTQQNFTTTLKNKLDGIAASANNYTLPFTNNSSNWNTAYGWGNHASAGYTNDQTAAEILTAIKTVDGSGSGLDADLLDGQQGSYYATASALTTTTATTNAALPRTGGAMTGTITGRDFKTQAGYHLQRSDHHSGHFEGSYNNIGANGPKSNPIYTIGSAYNPASTTLGNMYGIGYSRGDASFLTSLTGSVQWGMYVAGDGDARIWLGGTDGIIKTTGQHYVGANVVWNAGNDGAGSGLDADLLDGQHGSYYRAYANLTGTPTIPSLSGYATESYVGTQISNLVDSSPAALNTLNELAAALGDNASFATDVTTSIGLKSPIASPTFTGTLIAPTIKVGDGTDGFFYSDQAGRTAFNSGDFYIQTGVTNYYNYATNQYHGNSSGDNHFFRGNPLSGNSWSITAAGVITATGGNSGQWNTAYTYSQVGHLPLAGGNITGAQIAFTAASNGDKKLNFSGHGGASGYNYFLGAANDGGNKAVMFVNGSSRTADGGVNTFTIRNDAGPINVGRSTQTTKLLGSGELLFNSNKVFHAGNDGSGSGLDADLLDGQQGSYYLTASNFTGTLHKDRLPNFVHLGTSTTTGYATDDGSWGSRLNVSSTVHAKIEVSQEANSMRSAWYAHTGQTGIKFGTTTNHDVDFISNGASRLVLDNTGYVQINSYDNSWNGGLRLVSSDGTDTFKVHPDNNGYMYVDKTWYFTDAPHVGSIGNPVWHLGNDGSGSGLDADTVDGKHKDYLMHYKGLVSGNWDTIFSQTDGHMGVYEVQSINTTDTNWPTGAYTFGGVMSWQLDNSTFKLYAPHTGQLHYQTGWNNDEYSGWRKIWDTGNDGSGSGLDADLLDGQHGSYYYQASNPSGYTTNTGTLTAETVSSTNAVTITGTKYFQPAGTATSPLGGSGGASLQAYTTGTTAAYMAFHRSGAYAINWGLDTSNAMVLGGWSSSTTAARMSIGTNGLMVTAGQGNLWGASNDGAGSGLDADLLDGQQGSYYAPASGGNYWPSSGSWWASNMPGSRARGTADNGGEIVVLQDNPSNGRTSLLVDGQYYAGENGGFYSLYNGNNYNLKSGWNTNTSGQLLFSTQGHAQFNTQFGNIQIGPMNASYCHIYTNIAGGFYFNKANLYADGNTMWTSGNDGAGSGLDADLLDGQQGSFYRNASNIDAGTLPIARLPSPLNSSQAHAVTGSAFATTSSPGSVLEYQQASGQTDTRLAPSGDWHNTIRMGHGNPYNYYSNTIAARMTGTGVGDLYTQSIYNNTANGWRKIWSAGNDGAGSGLDADLLDGQHGSYYAPASHNHSGVYLPISGKAADSELLDGVNGASYLRSDADDSYTANNLLFPTLSLNIANNNGAGSGNTYFRGSSSHFVFGLTSGNTLYMNYGNSAGAFRTEGTITHNSALVGTTPWGNSNDGSGSGLDADLLDGLDSTDYRHYTWRSFVVAGDLDKFYPALFSVGNGNHGSSDLEIAQSNVHQNGSGHGAFYARFGVNITGWGHIPQMMTLREYSKTGNTYISKIGDTDHATGQIGIWLRGSTTYYYRSSDGAIFDSVRCTDNQPFLSYDNSNNAYDITISHTTTVDNAIFTNSAHTGKVLNTGNIGQYAWTSSTDGSGSTLDADLLDGQEGSYYAPASSIPSVGNGTLTVTTSGSASGSGTFTANQSGNTTINISATDTNTTYTTLPNGSNLNTAYGVTAGAGNGLKFWNGHDYYKISMGNSAEYHYGPVTDYSIKTAIDSNSSTRGFTWGQTGGTPIAGLNVGNGNMQIAGTFTGTRLFSTDGTNTISTFVSSTYNQITSIGSTNGGARDLRFNLGQSGTIMTINANKVQMHQPLLLDGAANTAQTSSNIISTQASDSSGATRYHLSFTKANGTTTLGRITTNNFATTYTTSSDYRLKEDLVEITGATAKVLSIPTRNFRWVGSDVRTDGFLAHELAPIVPDAVVGEKDGMTAPTLYLEGEELPEGISVGDIKVASVPDYQSVDQSKLVPLLVKTIQELEARITALENA